MTLSFGADWWINNTLIHFPLKNYFTSHFSHFSRVDGKQPERNGLVCDFMHTWTNKVAEQEKFNNVKVRIEILKGAVCEFGLLSDTEEVKRRLSQCTFSKSSKRKNFFFFAYASSKKMETNK